MNCLCCSGEAKKFGRFKNKNRIVQRYRCVRCSKTFSDKQPLDGLRVEFGRACQVAHLLCEGTGIRAASRLTGLDQETILNILEVAGQKAAALLDFQIRNVEVESVQCDEIFSYVFTKEFHNKLNNPEIGSQYTFLALDRKSKLIMSHYTGKRTRESGEIFMRDLKKRLKGRTQITTDGWLSYLPAVYNAFGANTDFAMQIKTYNDRDFGAFRDERRYSIGKGCKTVKTHVHIGWPKRELISTSHVERTNLSIRLFQRRFTRLTLGYSKKLANLRHSIALFVAHWNFCRVHSAHGQTPAVNAEITNHTWTIEELIGSTN
jgi:IS1 family transposase/transposase-like protein